MTNVTDTRFIDSSVWLGYFLSLSESVRQTIEEPGILYTSVLSLFEIQRKLLKLDIDQGQIHVLLNFIRKRSIFITVTDDVCIEAASLKLPAMDSIIYASALKNKSQFFTCDNDFRGLDGVTILV